MPDIKDNKFVTWTVCLFAGAVLIGLWLGKPSSPAPSLQPSEPIQIAETAPTNPTNAKPAIDALKTENKIKDVHYDPDAAVQWHIGVFDDGSSKQGFASYICDTLGEHQLVDQNTYVRIVDIAKIRKGQSFRKASLGRVNCSSYEFSQP